ncbi:MAG: hypothetical protein QG670_2717 [Thermoproteota archaeon]|nr:hypothetical protein [Thermoproteota archaeon]
MKTVIGSFYTITGCLERTLREVDASSWEALNPIQARFLRIFEACRSDVEKIREIEYEVGVGTVDPVNTFLKRKNIKIQLDQIKPKDVAIASVLDLLIEWVSEGKKSMIMRERKDYPAVLLNRGVLVSNVKDFVNPVAKITSKTEDKVYITILPEQPTSPFQIFELACKLIENQESTKTLEFNGVKFPMINLDKQPTIEWIIGIRANDWTIGQALQQIKLKLNEKGAHVKEAVAVTARASLISKLQQPLTIDKPFLLVFHRPSLKRPLFSAFLSEDCWQNPGSLDM